MPWDADFILFLQTTLPDLTAIMAFFSFLGSEQFYLLVMPVVYWCVDANLGLRVATLLITSEAVNSLFKLAFHRPRPYWVEPRIQALSAEPTYGLPSGHAQTAVAVWGGLALQIKQRWLWGMALLIIFLISVSRIYLGVHFVTDVVGGWLIGGALLWALGRWGEGWAARLKQWRLWQQVTLALGVALGYLILSAVIVLALAAVPDPLQWGTLAATATGTPPGTAAINPRDPEGLVSAAGRIFGLGLSLALLVRGGRFSARGAVVQLALRFIIGVVGVLVFWLGLRFIFPTEGDAVAWFFRFVRYTLVVVWALYLAPWVFLKLKLAQPLDKTPLPR
jgi:membrane-associated phospholipid phosphatase